MVRAWWTSTNHHALNLLGLQRCCVFLAASKQPGDQIRCLLMKLDDCFDQNYIASHIFGNVWEIIEAWLGSPLTWHPLITVYFEVWTFTNDDDFKSHLVQFYFKKWVLGHTTKPKLRSYQPNVTNQPYCEN